MGRKGTGIEELFEGNSIDDYHFTVWRVPEGETTFTIDNVAITLPDRDFINFGLMLGDVAAALFSNYNDTRMRRKALAAVQRHHNEIIQRLKAQRSKLQ